MVHSLKKNCHSEEPVGWRGLKHPFAGTLTFHGTFTGIPRLRFLGWSPLNVMWDIKVSVGSVGLQGWTFFILPGTVVNVCRQFRKLVIAGTRGTTAIILKLENPELISKFHAITKHWSSLQWNCVISDTGNVGDRTFHSWRMLEGDKSNPSQESPRYPLTHKYPCCEESGGTQQSHVAFCKHPQAESNCCVGRDHFEQGSNGLGPVVAVRPRCSLDQMDY